MYNSEREGQMAFFDNYRIPYKDDDSILVDNTDGVYHGNILEFKLNISNTGSVLFQAIKYLSRMRVRGESVPARILLIDLNASKVYVYQTADYIDDVQKTYTGAASKNNETFSGNVKPKAVYDYMDMADSAEVLRMLINRNEEWYIPIDIDETCIVGWAERYYREVPNATKGDFLGDGTGKINLTGEIREPKHFRGLINPYTEETNERFMYLMDCLNSRLAKKDLGAFYTPEPYARKAGELVMKAVERVPEGNDYIILDRCSGSGALEAGLIGLKDRNGDELISHCVVSTYEYYEYKVLMERIGDLVRDVIPPTEANICFENGVISNADAMSEEYVNNPIIRRYVEDEKCTIIMYENPPYRDAGASDTQNTKGFKKFVNEEMKKENLANKTVAYDLANMFIWSAYKYYLRQKTDSYVLFSPIKYWKIHALSQMKCIDGYIFNRKYFHATASAIFCILWANIPEDNETLKLKAFDIKEGKTFEIESSPIICKKAHQMSNKLLPSTKSFSGAQGIVCGLDGVEVFKKARGKALYNEKYFAYLRLNGFNLDALNRTLTTVMPYPAMGRYLCKDNYLMLLPLFDAKLFSEDEWYERDIYATTSDGGDAYTHDELFLKRCLIYTVLSNQNKCLSFTGSDGRFYRNELTLDDTNGDTCASSDLAKLFAKYPPDCDEQKLISLWDLILEEAKKTANYNPDLTYGVYQITKELNTSHKEGKGKSKKTIYDYPMLNGYLISLRDTLKAYYKSHITELMFRYELLK